MKSLILLLAVTISRVQGKQPLHDLEATKTTKPNTLEHQEVDPDFWGEPAFLDDGDAAAANYGRSVKHCQGKSDHCGRQYPGVTCCPGFSCQSTGVVNRQLHLWVCKPVPTAPGGPPKELPVPGPNPTPVCCPIQGRQQCGRNTQCHGRPNKEL